MQVFKFGGASVNDAIGITNVTSVLKTMGYKNTLIVISAIGKTTNALELVVNHYFNNKAKLNQSIELIKTKHYTIALNLFSTKNHPVFKKIDQLFNELHLFLNYNKSPNYNFVYDQVVCYGELLSTTLVSYYLNHNGIKNTWIDVRTCIKTNDNYRNAQVNWQLTANQITTNINTSTLYITQGFIASDANNFTTTLGREGSDYTAAIFAYVLNAQSVTIWKDVEGVLNADPRYFKNPKLLSQISYNEAIELAFYGASVIHPKTLQPLQKKEIPLYVKSFLNPKQAGTVVNKTQGLTPKLPCYILKKQQILLSLSSLDFSYSIEKNISTIFNLLSKYKMKVHLIQNSAISFSVCLDDPYKHLEALLLDLKAKFKITCHKNVKLYTIRHFTNNNTSILGENPQILLKQILQDTMQIVKA